MPDESRNHVSITDVDMPFLSMVRFMVKWAIASIPALIILMILAAIFWGTLIAVVASVGSALSRAKTPTTVEMPHTPSRSVVAEQSSAVDTATAQRLSRLKTSVSVTLVSMKEVDNGFMKAVEIKYELQNTSSKEIRAFQGKVNFKDILGNDLTDTHINITKPLKSGERRTVVGHEVMTPLQGKGLDEVKTEWLPETVLFADGERIDLEMKPRS
jgi:hypothetical protein